MVIAKLLKSDSSLQTLNSQWLGLQRYEDTWQRMRAFTNARDGDAVDELWLLEHFPVFTLGQAARPEHVLNPGDIPIVQTDRGGQVTYHGPGQLVVYTLLDLGRRKFGVRELVTRLEKCLIDLLECYQIHAQRKSGAPGVYVDGDKIAALGLRVRRGCSFHGISLNVNMDLTPFENINPCGYAGLKVVSIQNFVAGQTLSVEEAGKQFLEIFCREFEYQI